jgi:hypothetical protein
MQQWSSSRDHAVCAIKRRGWYCQHGRVFGKMDWTGFAVDRRAGSVGEPRGDISPGTIRITVASQLPNDLYLSDMQIDERDLRYWLKRQTATDAQPAARLPTPVEHKLQSAHAGASIGQDPVRTGAENAPQSAAPAGVAARSISASVPIKRKHNGLDHRAADVPLVAEMQALIEARKARSPDDAARAVVDRAEGHGTPESKVKRLAKHYRETPRAQS